ncbi:MAG: hypothetical protein AAF125_22160, partial [Chloroflexota bacterium]
RMGTAWVYGEPETLRGLWDQISGAEASRFIGPPSDLAGLWANLQLVNGVLLTDLTLVGLALGLAGLVAGALSSRYRRASITMLLSGGVAYGFHVLFYTDVLSALILPIIVSIGFGWAFGADLALRRMWARGLPTVRDHARLAWGGLAVGLVVFGGVMWTRNAPFIHELVTDPRGVETIAQLQTAPEGATVMLPWGPRHFAAGYAVDISGELAHLTLVDHKADYTTVEGPLVTPEYTRFRYPIAWWEDQLGGPVYPQSAGLGIVELQPEADITEMLPSGYNRQPQVICDVETLYFAIAWMHEAAIESDYSVFVHLLDDDGALLAQDDRVAPVYGWRPTTTWQPNERIRDLYALPRDPNGAMIRYGLYYQDADGAFINVTADTVPLGCGVGQE